jgi:hypothetical protein
MSIYRLIVPRSIHSPLLPPFVLKRRNDAEKVVYIEPYRRWALVCAIPIFFSILGLYKLSTHPVGRDPIGLWIFSWSIFGFFGLASLACLLTTRQLTVSRAGAAIELVVCGWTVEGEYSQSRDVRIVRQPVFVNSPQALSVRGVVDRLIVYVGKESLSVAVHSDSRFVAEELGVLKSFLPDSLSNGPPEMYRL